MLLSQFTQILRRGTVIVILHNRNKSGVPLSSLPSVTSFLNPVALVVAYMKAVSLERKAQNYADATTL